jgi:hypothetical protein
MINSVDRREPGSEPFGGKLSACAAHAMCPATAAGLIVAALMLAATWSQGAGAQSVECVGAQKPRQVAELLFGRKIGDRLGVSQRDFGRFVDREIAPRFPDGLTVLDAAGARDDIERKTVVHEPSKVVEIVMPGNADDVDRLGEIAEAYKRQFHQQSVGIVTRAACVSF